MRRTLCLLVVYGGLVRPCPAAAERPRPLVEGLDRPTSIAVGADGRVYVATLGPADKQDSGAVLVLKDGKALPFAKGISARGLAAWQQWLFTADQQRIWRIDPKGKAEVFVAAEAFPTPPRLLNDLTVDPESGTLYASDWGQPRGSPALYRISPKGKVSVITDAKRSPVLETPIGLALDGASHLLVVDLKGVVHRVRVSDGTLVTAVDDLGGGHKLAWDRHGRLYVSDHRRGKVFVIPRPGEKAVELAKGFQHPSGLCMDPSGKSILVTDQAAGTITALPAQVPGAAVDQTPLPIETAMAFPNLRWTGWKAEDAAGKVAPLRPIVLTHAGDGSNRLFVATEQGVIHVFPNDPKTDKTRVFLDLQDRVVYDDKQNEEGLLGLAFHPKYKKNGEFFVFYTTKKAKKTNVLSRFRVRADDPDKADPASEEELLRVERPYWNHDGGTLCFGPDGYLYLALGDGGDANDPHDNGQNLKSLLGKVLRLDVDRKEKGKAYAIPPDNPFVGRQDARPETWAYGLRNVWRMAFDRKTGTLWAGDVGQNLYEEINLLTKGGNYGWRRREGLHPFGSDGSGPRPGLIDPIWEYSHDVGKSIIGGNVYRGPRLPELDGAYIYGDYVTAKIWALWYDPAKRRVVANRPLRDRNMPMFSFGEDERGEVYMLAPSANGQGIYWFVRAEAGKK